MKCRVVLSVLTLLVVLASPLYAADASCIVVSISGGGSIVHGNTRVRSSIKVGDTIFEGDRMDLSFGTKLTLSFDKVGLDVMQFEGPAILKFHTPTQIEISNGTASVVLDNTRSYKLFKIKTPSATASGRGAHFQVDVINKASEIRSYKGNVDVSGVSPSGVETSPAVTVAAGKKTTVKKPGDVAIEPVDLNGMDLRKMDLVKGAVQKAANWMKQKTPDWIRGKFQKSKGRGGSSDDSSLRGGGKTGDDIKGKGFMY